MRFVLLVDNGNAETTPGDLERVMKRYGFDVWDLSTDERMTITTALLTRAEQFAKVREQCYDNGRLRAPDGLVANYRTVAQLAVEVENDARRLLAKWTGSELPEPIQLEPEPLPKGVNGNTPPNGGARYSVPVLCKNYEDDGDTVADWKVFRVSVTARTVDKACEAAESKVANAKREWDHYEALNTSEYPVRPLKSGSVRT